MLVVNLSFKHLGEQYSFNLQLKCGEVHKFEVGERMLADKLFWCLCGLDGDCQYKINVSGQNISFKNDILALGDGTMFLDRSVDKNVYKALRVRHKRKEARQKTSEVMKIYELESALDVAIARAHFRNFKLLIVNCFDTYIQNSAQYFDKRKNHLPKREELYILEVH